MNIDLRPLRGKRVICAVSGGADSMCLLHILHQAGIDVIAAHYEHGIRGEESERDLNFVQSWCEQFEIPFIFARGDVPAYAAQHAMGMEEAARKLRYEFLEAQCLKLNCELIATAHNANDNAETIIFNLSRGSGTQGLAGIPPRRGFIIRPLLNVTRAEIEEYLEKNAVPHVEDSTNNSDDYTRNLIRHRIMPLLEDLNPRFVQAAGRTSQLMRRDEEALQLLTDKFHAENFEEDECVSCAALLEAPVAVASRYLRSWISGLSMEHVDQILDFCRGEGYGELDVPGRRLCRDLGKLYFYVPKYIPIGDHRLTPGNFVWLPERGMWIETEIVEYQGEVNDLFKTSYLKYEIMGSDVYISSRKAGDSMRPAGRNCSKSLKALFTEHSIPALRRDNIPVIRDEQGILMVHGIAMDERAVPKPGDKALKINFSKI
ncbi:MAG: tRNA lysidine(34) synthetase TilS [Oscillospiraceae bacterium]|nr:tRNA lysidine(34) synthetase TilS [Oscillospiraceae bacterium]